MTFANTQSYYGYGKYPLGPSDIYNIRIDSSYSQANTANTGAKDAYNRAEAAFYYANTIGGGPYADNVARVSTNTATIKVAAAYNQANVTIGVDTTQNTRLTVIEGTDSSQNARMTIIEGVNTSQNSRMTIIEGTNTTQNTNISATDGKMQSGYSQANTGTVLAQAAYNTMNTFVSTTTTDNTSRVLAQSAFIQANTAYAQTVYLQSIDNTQNSLITIIQGVDVTQNTGIAATDGKMQSVYTLANTHDALIPAAFTVANSAAANTVYTQAVDNSQNSSIVIIQGVDVSQNARLTIIEGTDTSQNSRMDIIEATNVSQNTNISNRLALTGATSQNVAGNVIFTGSISANVNSINSANSVGYLGVPQNRISSFPYTFVLSDIGKQIFINDSAGSGTITIPTAANVSLPVGAIISVANWSGTKTLTLQNSGTMQMYVTGNSTTRTSITINPYAMLALTHVISDGTNDIWYISGAGII
jgi:hypothetical protein